MNNTRASTIHHRVNPIELIYAGPHYVIEANVLQCNVKPSMHLQMETCSVQRNVISDQCARSIVILVLILLDQDRELVVLRDDGPDCHLRVS